MPKEILSCFKAYDVRGEIDLDINESIVCRIAKALTSYLNAKKIVVGFDARETSPSFADAVTRGIIESGADVLFIGMAGTEEMYWAVTEYDACGGIEVTASHNPINFNGLKMVREGSRPLSEDDFEIIKRLTQENSWTIKKKFGSRLDISVAARNKYINKVLSFIDPRNLREKKILINCGNGAAGPTVNKIIEALVTEKFNLNIIKMHFNPDPSFPFGVPNPILPENQKLTSEAIVKFGADMGIAFDGDFDRCFFFDETGRFIPGEYIVSLISEIFLDRNNKETIIHDPRTIWSTLDVAQKKGGKTVLSKTGHSFIKSNMRKYDAVYGGEMSAHHYFRDFAFCDSGIIPWLLIFELISKTNMSLKKLVDNMFDNFPSSGERNFKVSNPEKVIEAIFDEFKHGAVLDETDGCSFSFKNWRFNIRKSNTEGLLRLNVEAKDSTSLVKKKAELISQIIEQNNI